MSFWIGMDVGGTRMRVAVFNQNLTQVSFHEFLKVELSAGQNIDDAGLLFEALHRVGIDVSAHSIAGIAAGWAGYAARSKAATLEQAIKSRFPQVLAGIFSDAETALVSIFGRNDGLISIHGTGSLQLIQQQGKLTRLNGFGPWIGDFAGGISIGRQGVKQAVTDLQTGRSSKLSSLFLDFAGTGNWLEWIFSLRDDPGKLASFAPVVFQLAAEGDQAAGKIVKNELEGVEILIESRRLSEGFLFSVYGGLLQNDWFKNTLIKSFEDLSLTFQPVAPDPCKGAVLLLKAAAGHF